MFTIDFIIQRFPFFFFYPFSSGYNFGERTCAKAILRFVHDIRKGMPVRSHWKAYFVDLLIFLCTKREKVKNVKPTLTLSITASREYAVGASSIAPIL